MKNFLRFFAVAVTIATFAGCEKPYDPTTGPMDAPIPLFAINPFRWGMNEAEVDAAMEAVKIQDGTRDFTIEEQPFGRVYFIRTHLMYVANFGDGGLSEFVCYFSGGESILKEIATLLGQKDVARQEYPVLRPAVTSNTKIEHYVGGSLTPPDMITAIKAAYPPGNVHVQTLTYIPK